MKTIVITLPHFFDGEGDAIAKLLSIGAERVHVRKPGCCESDMRHLLESVAPELRSRLSLHDCLELASEYGAGGVNLNSRNPYPPAGWAGLVSRSCHSISELATNDADYCFLSPVYDSFSKPEYRGTFTVEDFRGVDLSRVYALGGLCGSRLSEIESMGFAGAAMLGAVWNPVDSRRFRLQFITHDNGKINIVDGVRMALEGGCRWVQLRMKDASPAEVVNAAKMIATLCRRYGAIFLLNDHVNLVRLAGADGVHVGKNDMSVAEAKRVLGPGFIVGATANTFADVVRAAAEGADYVGLGPYRFTTTKKRLNPLLGIDGYRSILTRCRQEGIVTPIVAIGGITADDVSQIMEVGVQGIAVSGAILNAKNPITETQKICQLL